MSSSIWLTGEQLALLRAALLRARRANGVAHEPMRAALIESALSRLHNGTYGECVGCEEPLGFELLELRPEAPFCEQCEQERKRGHGHRNIE